MIWLTALDKTERAKLQRFDEQIAALRMQWKELHKTKTKLGLNKLEKEIAMLRLERYKLQNAATQRVRRNYAEQKKRRKTQPTKRRSRVARNTVSFAV